MRALPDRSPADRGNRSTTWAGAAARLALLGCISILLAGGARAGAPSDPGAPAATRFGWGRKYAAFSLGYGLGFRTGSREDRAKSRELGDVSLIEVVPRLGVGVTDPLGADAWYRGNFDMLLEGSLFFNTRPRSGVGGGAGAALRYNFLSGRNAVPFLDIYFGMVSVDLDLKGQSDGFSFNVGWGGGLHLFVSERAAVTPELRYQHFSNAGIEHPNHGINDMLFMVGFSYFVD